uniref:Fucosyltransferase n=1 Tax=Panagrolaimus sp. JU765 TaxID=591449 RepID=A0AC34Q8W0_9BILA
MAKINWLKIGILILMTKFLKALTIVEKVLEQQNIKVEPQLLWVYNPFYQGDERVMKHGNCSVQVFKDPEYAPLSEIVVVNANSRLEMFENVAKNKNQIWIMELLESPVHTKNLNFFDGKINYTASYHADSDLPIPYGFLVENQNSSELAPIFPSEKPKKAVFVASNCWTSNSRSLLVDQLSRHYAIDRLGACGNGRIPRKQLEKSLKTNYRYFLAFENSNCEDYITEKVFTAFKHDLIPIVYGAPKSSYENLLPENSFIFVEDFQSVNDLAK